MKALLGAFALVAFWGVLELLGARDATVALAGGACSPATRALAMVYLGAWFAMLLVAPPLVGSIADATSIRVGLTVSLTGGVLVLVLSFVMPRRRTA